MNYTFSNGSKLQVGTMFCIGRNYSKHASEMGGDVPEEPIIFLKPPQAYVPNEGTIKLPKISNNVHYEVELVVVIGENCANVTKENAYEYIAGYAVGIDVTMRDLQFKAKSEGNPWAVCKGFYTSAPISEVVLASQFYDKNSKFDLVLKLNNEIRQKASTREMERSVGQLIEYISNIFTLRAGDCIFTGTPEGVGPITKGDMLHAELVGQISLDVKVE